MREEERTCERARMTIMFEEGTSRRCCYVRLPLRIEPYGEEK